MMNLNFVDRVPRSILAKQSVVSRFHYYSLIFSLNEFMPVCYFLYYFQARTDLVCLIQI